MSSMVKRLTLFIGFKLFDIWFLNLVSLMTDPSQVRTCLILKFLFVSTFETLADSVVHLLSFVPCLQELNFVGFVRLACDVCSVKPHFAIRNSRCFVAL